MADNNHQYDDLKVIKGIGKNRAQWLRNSLDIQTLRDLSMMSAADIETRLKAEGFIISRAKIDHWIEQARQILAETAQENMAKTTGLSNEVGDEENMPQEAGEEQVARLLDVSDANAVSGLEIIRIQAFQPAQTMRYAGSSRAGQPFLGSLNSEESFALEASINVTDEISNQVATGEANFSIQFDAYDPQTGLVTHLGNTRPAKLQPDQKTQSAVLSSARLNKGLYRLRISGTLHGETPATGYLEVPYFQVM